MSETEPQPGSQAPVSVPEQQAVSDPLEEAELISSANGVASPSSELGTTDTDVLEALSEVPNSSELVVVTNRPGPLVGGVESAGFRWLNESLAVSERYARIYEIDDGRERLTGLGDLYL